MAVYGAATSLLNTLSQLLEDPDYPYQQHITNLGNGVNYLRCFLWENLEVKREFEIQIRDAIYEAQYIVDSRLWSIHDFLSPSETEISSQSFCEELERLIQKVNSIGDMAESEKFTDQTLEWKISESILRNPDEVEGLNKYHIVGRHDDFVQLQDRLVKGSAGLEVVPIVGIGGMGKTSVAYVFFFRQEIRKHFGINAWAKVPIEYQKRHVLLDLLESMKKVGDGIHQMTDDQLAKLLYNSFKRKRYLVLLDNIREIAVWNDLKELFPDYYDGSRILLTTRNVDIARIAGTPHLLDRVSDQDSLILLREIVFRQEEFSSDFHVILKAIAESCRGHPHAVKIVGQLLRCAKPILEYWEMVSSSINACDNYGNLIETLVSLTYKHLHQILKVCFLYMAMFPYEYNIHLWTLVDLWIAEGFIKLHNLNPSSKEDMEFVMVCFKRLYHRDLISYNNARTEKEKQAIKISEEVFHDFLMRTAKEEKFFLAINKDTNFEDSLQEEYNAYNQQCRFFIRKNIVLFVNENNSSNTSISNARSLLYYGPEPQYPLSAWLHDFELLRVLDILKVRFYSFPPEIPNSIQLRYLALSYNGKLPAAMCRLRNLQFLIVICYLSVKSSGAPSYLPLDIWNMNTLWKLEVMGSDLPEPPSDTDLKLENLLTLSGVSSHSCTKAILERIPNLYDFGIQIESLVEDECLSFFSHLHILNKLYGFKCVVMYPNIGSPVGPCFIPSFPSTLADLTLSGCGFPWDYISVIATLPNLHRLHLQNYAFQGPQWEVKKDEFLNLTFFLLEDMDLKNWILAEQSCFPAMALLYIRHCYKLQEVPYAIGDIPTLKMLEVVDCSTSAMNSALKIEEEKHSQGNDSVEFVLYSSRDD